MKIYLLTHERELLKKTNTGRLVKRVLGERVDIIVWKRKEPDQALLELIEEGKVLMLYPDKGEHENESFVPEQVSSIENFLILDSTWQEARKMYNKSHYLQTVEKLTIKPERPSEYCLRRNQIEGGLSTAECAIELLKIRGDSENFERLKMAFQDFNLK